MEFRLLGPVTASAGNEEGRIGELKHRHLLAVLLTAEGKTVSTERLIDLLWEERLPAKPRERLYEYVGSLRANLRAIDPTASDILRQHNGGYQLLVEPDQLDVSRFKRLVSQARLALNDNDAQAVALLERALGEWRGEDTDLSGVEPLAGLTGTWVGSYRDSLWAARRDAVLLLLNAKLRLGQHDEVIARLVGPVHAEPPDENLGQVLMLAYHRSGQSQQALKVYRQLRRRLDDIGVRTGPQLDELHRRILQQDPALLPPRPDHPDRPEPSAAPRSERVRQPDRPPAPAPVVNGGIYNAGTTNVAGDQVAGDKYVDGTWTSFGTAEGDDA